MTPVAFKGACVSFAQAACLPEIGSKSVVSRVLSGERNLTKKHIQALSQRFGISPAVFFLRSRRDNQRPGTWRQDG